MPIIDWRALRDFERRKRTSKEEKEYWAKEIISAVQLIIKEHGNLVEISGMATKVVEVQHAPFTIIYSTPFNNIIGHRYGLDIWFRDEQDGGKVFFVQWEPLDIIRFDRGLWIEKLLGLVRGVAFYVD